MHNAHDNTLISIIIPIYKVERYINECINSVIRQTYTNIEIILVDDGSPDHCPEICDCYSNQDNRIIVIHKNNGGLSDARNAGMKVSTGKYVTFIDGDDIVSIKYIERMLELAIKNNADIVQINYTKDKANLGLISDDAVKVFTHDDAMKNLLRMQDIKEASWGKLYKREIAEKVVFPVGRLYEDVLTAYKFVYHSRVFVCDTLSNLYYYRPNPDGIMHKKLSITRFSVLSIIKEMKEFLKNNYSKYASDCSYYFMRHMINVYNECIVEGGDKEYSCIMNQIREKLIRSRQKGLWKDYKYELLISLLAFNKIFYKFTVKILRYKWK